LATTPALIWKEHVFMSNIVGNTTKNGSVPSETVQFLQALFQPANWVLLRQIETWTENGKKKSKTLSTNYRTACDLWTDEDLWRIEAENAEARHGNQFFGVCPRLRSGDYASGRYDFAWQIRTVQALWSDVDTCPPDKIAEKCRSAGVPEPSIVVNSGRAGGASHVYWLLDTPYLIDDCPDPVPAFWDKETKRTYILGADGQRIYTLPEISPKAIRVQRAMRAVAKLIGGDKTQDLSRLLRIPGTWNRKNERTGQQPVMCTVHSLDASRRYPIEEFQRFVKDEPPHEPRAFKAPVKVEYLGTGLPGDDDNFLIPDEIESLIEECERAPLGERSEVCFKLLVRAIDLNIPQAVLWERVGGMGRFGEKGRSHFDKEWRRAQGCLGESFRLWKEERQRPCTKKPETYNSDKDEREQTAEAQAQQDTRRRRGYKLNALRRLPQPDWLVKGHYQEDSLVAIIGPSGVGKSFVALDQGLCVAHGRPYLGCYDVKPGPVVYVAGEGVAGVVKRVEAWLTYNGMADDPENFVVVPATFNLLEQGEAIELLKIIDADLGDRPRLVIVDTLARNFGGGDENATKDMNAFVQNCDLLRRHTKTTVLVIHHTGKEAAKKERGNSALRGACDTLFMLEDSDKGKGALVKCDKQKDHEPVESYKLLKKKVALPVTPNGEERSSLVYVGQDHWTTAFELLKPKQRALLFSLYKDFFNRPFRFSEGWKSQQGRQDENKVGSKETYSKYVGELVEKKMLKKTEDSLAISDHALSVLAKKASG
jgi:AAA domain